MAFAEGPRPRSLIPGDFTRGRLEISSESLRAVQVAGGGVDSAERLREMARQSAVSRAAAAAGQAGPLAMPRSPSPPGLLPARPRHGSMMRVQSREKIHGHAVAPGDIFQPSESTDDKVGYIELLAAQAEEPPSTESEQVRHLRKTLASSWESVKLCVVVGSRRETDRHERALTSLLAHLSAAGEEVEKARNASQNEIDELKKTVDLVQDRARENARKQCQKGSKSLVANSLKFIFENWGGYSIREAAKRREKKAEEKAKAEAAAKEEKNMQKIMLSMGVADDKQKLKTFFQAWASDYLNAKEQMAKSAALVVGMLGANAKVQAQRCFKAWAGSVLEKKADQAAKLNEADQEELVEVVKELEQAYHTERYQTKALKERVKELEAEVARVTDLLDSERKGSEVLNRQVLESTNAADSVGYMRRLDENLQRVLHMMGTTHENVNLLTQTSTTLSAQMQHLQQNAGRGPSVGPEQMARDKQRADAFNSYRQPVDPQREMLELEIAMKKWHQCEEVKRSAVSRIQDLGGSPPRCVTLHSNLPPTGNPQSPVSTPVILPPAFAVTGEQWSISAEDAWAYARKEVDRDSNATLPEGAVMGAIHAVEHAVEGAAHRASEAVHDAAMAAAHPIPPPAAVQSAPPALGGAPVGRRVASPADAAPSGWWPF